MDTVAQAAPFSADSGESITNATVAVKATDTICTVQEQIGAHYVGGSVEIGGVERRIIWVSTSGLEDNHGAWGTVGPLTTDFSKLFSRSYHTDIHSSSLFF
eukprot:COSAG03_NODE_6277_length_1085_cov_0.589249_1_plen_101_part_00